MKLVLLTFFVSVQAFATDLYFLAGKEYRVSLPDLTTCSSGWTLRDIKFASIDGRTMIVRPLDGDDGKHNFEIMCNRSEAVSVNKTITFEKDGIVYTKTVTETEWVPVTKVEKHSATVYGINGV